MHVIPIHKYPSLLDECCNLINMEWPRSRTARMRTLRMSCDTLPTCLALVSENGILGHSKVSAIGSILGACFVESVVIHPDHRGKGLGRLIMTETEKFAASQGMDTIYLSTIDQHDFYKKLGYTECAPVSIYGCSISNYGKQIEMSSVGNEEDKRDISFNNTVLPSPLTTTLHASPPASVSPLSLPPPPPFPVKTADTLNKVEHFGHQGNKILSRKTYFKKNINRDS